MKSVRWARRDGLGWFDRYPFLALSLFAHAVLLAALWALGPQSPGQQPKTRRSVQDEALIDAALQRAHQRHLERRVQALEALQREWTGAPPPHRAVSSQSPDPLMDRARAAVEAIRLAEQRRRAEELARLLKLPPDRALAKARAETSAENVKTGTPAQELSLLESQARAAVAREAARLKRSQEGVPVLLFGGAAQGGSSGASGHSGRGGGKAGGPAYSFFEDRVYIDRRPVDLPQPQRLGTGHRFGAGGVFADRVYIDRWYLAGPFEAQGHASLEKVYPPEFGVDLDAAYAGKDMRTLRWRYTGDQTYPVAAEPHAENSIYYGYTELRVDQEQEVWLDIGADDDGKLWLNDELVWTSDSGDKPWYRQPYYTLRPQLLRFGLVEASVRVRLRAGNNTLLFKHFNASGIKFFAVVLRPV